MRRMETVHQAEANECGLAALTMVARGLGHDIDLPWARQRFPATGRRPDLASVLDMARSLGLDARPLKAEVTDLCRLRLPAILHWELRHFVVLARAGRRHVDICDPAAGRRRVSLEELRHCFTGVAVEFTRGPDFAAVRGGRRLRLADVFAAFRGLKSYLVVIFTLLVATQLLALAVPVGTQLLIDEIVRGQDRQWLYSVAAGLACVMLAALVLDTLRQHYSLFTGIRVSVDTASAMVRHVLGLPLPALERRTIADTLSRIDSLQPIQKVLTETVLSGLVQAVTFILTLALMVFYSPTLAAMALAAVIAGSLVQAAMMPRMRARNLDGLVAQAMARQSLLESLAAAASVHAFGLQGRRAQHWLKVFIQASNARADQGKLAILASAARGFIGLVDQIAFLAVGVVGIGNKSLTLGILFAFLTLRGRLAAAVAGLTAAGHELYLLRNHLERVGDLLCEPPLPRPAPSALRAVPTGRIDCENLSYAWSGGGPLISGFHCAIEAGERVVLCGPSGIGKTTLLRLLALELEPAGGRILLDGWDSGLWDRGHLQLHAGIVRQPDRLFTGSIADNITGFSPCPDPRRIRRAAELAVIWEDLLALPMRLETAVADGGAGLSGGQVQRLLLARALYREPCLLFLDEATNQLDRQTERRVLSNIAALGITIVSIAHSAEALLQSGRVIHL
jgi:ATP-binding cassette, subfamily B, bacterial CvaB/MchF/RaxB